MNLENFDAIVIVHRNSTLVFCSIMMTLGIALMFLLYVTTKQKISYLLLLPIFAIIVYSSVVIINCNKDIHDDLYEVYVGNCTYEAETVTFEDNGLKFNVGMGHEFVPQGESYGKCIYSKNSKIIVYWEYIEKQE